MKVIILFTNICLVFLLLTSSKEVAAQTGYAHKHHASGAKSVSFACHTFRFPGRISQKKPLILHRKYQHSTAPQWIESWGLFVFLSVPTILLDTTMLIGNIVARSQKRGMFGWGVAGVVISGLTTLASWSLLFTKIFEARLRPGLFSMFVPGAVFSISSFILSVSNLVLFSKFSTYTNEKISLAPFFHVEAKTGNVQSGMMLSGAF